MSLPATHLRVVLYEGLGAAPLPAEERFAAVRALVERGYAVTCVSPGAHVAPPDRSHLLVLGRFDSIPAAEAIGPETQVEFHQLPADAEDLGRLAEEARARLQAPAPGEWKPWFPVIDYDRCTNCMQCLSFCLFGVYGVDADRRIEVQNNDNCKTNCPACSRVCPEAAIMFPKYQAGPINGDQVSRADLEREKMKIDISALLGGDVYNVLRERSAKAKSRFSKERDADKALQERKKCLVKLQQMGDIPLEVLMALPSPEEIQRRALEATERVQAALAAPKPEYRE